MFKFNTIDEAIEDIKTGKMIVVVDDEDRENEGDLVMAAEMVTPESINFMVTHAKGLVCVPMTSERLKELGISLMVRNNTDSYGTAFTVSVDAAETDTGIAVHERSLSIKKLTDPKAKAYDFKQPGHVFPLIAKDKGVLKRNGHTEAAVDMAKLSGFAPVGVICEVLKDDGTMARVPDLMEFVKEHGLKIITIADLITYRRHKEVFCESVKVESFSK